MSHLIAIAWMLACLAFAGRAEATPSRGQPVATVEDEVTQQVQQSLPHGLSLIDVNMARALPIRPGTTVSLSWPAAPRPGRVSVLVIQRDATREVARTWAQVELRAPRRVVVADRDLAVGAPVTAQDLVVEERPVGPAEGLVLDPASLIGARVLRAVRAGAVVAAEDLVLPAPSPRGTAVRIVIERRGVSVSTPGLLERPVRLGEEGQARLLAGTRMVTGRLVDRATLVVEGDR